MIDTRPALWRLGVRTYGRRIVGVALLRLSCVEPGNQRIAWPEPAGPAASPGFLPAGP